VSTPPIRLVPTTPAHAAGMGELIRDPEVLRFTRVPDPPPADFVESWLQRYEAGRADGTREALPSRTQPMGGSSGSPSRRRSDATSGPPSSGM
jgi:hypothetical protein